MFNLTIFLPGKTIFHSPPQKTKLNRYQENLVWYQHIRMKKVLGFETNISSSYQENLIKKSGHIFPKKRYPKMAQFFIWSTKWAKVVTIKNTWAHLNPDILVGFLKRFCLWLIFAFWWVEQFSLSKKTIFEFPSLATFFPFLIDQRPFLGKETVFN